MKTCEYCNKPITSKWANKKTRFCSRKCSNFYRKQTGLYDSHSQKLVERAKTEKWGALKLTKEERSENNQKKKEKYNKLRQIGEKTYSRTTKPLRERVFSRPFDKLSFECKRHRVFLEQENICAICGISEWLEKPIRLHLDHIDGDRDNNVRDNLRGICPNCHSTTDTYCGRNNKRGKFPIAKVFYERFQQDQSIGNTLRHFGLAPKGGNYQKARFMLQQYDPDIQFEIVRKFK